LSDNPLPQDAFRSRPKSDEDKYYAQREQEILEDLRDARAARSKVERRCPCPECDGNLLDRVMYENVEVDRCSRCQGVWLDAGEMELLTGRAKQQPGNALTRFFQSLAPRAE
jgi:hypothetical protein